MDGFLPPISDAMGPTFNLDHNGVSYRSLSLDGLRAAGLAEDALLATLRSHLKAQVDAKAEALRSTIATPGAGQAMEYQEVQTQAVAALKAPASASAAKYPMLAATIDVDIDPDTGEPATDVLGVARSITAAYQLWQMAGAAIRGARLGAKKAIDEAASIDEAQAAFDAIAWPNFSGG